MPAGAKLDAADLATLLESWELTLRAERKSPQTIGSYGDGVRRFLAWATAEERPPALDRATLAAFTAGLLDAGAAPATAVSRHLAVRRFSAWLAAEGEIEQDQVAGVRAPKIDQKVDDPLTEDETRLLLKACSGLDAFRDRRDEALIRLMIETAGG